MAKKLIIEFNELLKVMNKQALKSQKRGFKKALEEEFGILLGKEMTRAQKNRILQLFGHLSKAYINKEFKVTEMRFLALVIDEFRIQTQNINKQKIRTIYDSFLSVPVYVLETGPLNPRKEVKLPSHMIGRSSVDVWGRRSRLGEIIEELQNAEAENTNDGAWLRRYSKILMRANKAKV